MGKPRRIKELNKYDTDDKKAVRRITMASVHFDDGSTLEGSSEEFADGTITPQGCCIPPCNPAIEECNL